MPFGEYKFLELINASADGIVVVDEDGVVRFVNVSAEDIFKRAAAEIIGKPFGLPVIAGRTTEIDIIPPNKKPVTVIMSMAKTRWNNKAAVIATLHDITARKETEQRTLLYMNILNRLSKPGTDRGIIYDILHLIREYSGYTNVGVCLQELNSDKFYENSNYSNGCRTMDKPVCNIFNNGMVLSDSKLTNSLCMCECNLIDCLKDKTLSITEYGSYWTNCNNNLKFIIVEEVRLVDEPKYNNAQCDSIAFIPLKSNNNTLGLLVLNDRRSDVFTSELIKFYESIGQNIGIVLERMRVEEELQRSEKKYRTLFQQSKDAIYIANANGGFIDCNESMLDLFALRREEIMKLAIKDIYVDYDDYLKHLDEIERHGFIIDHDMKMCKKNGAIIECLISLTGNKNNEGTIVGFQGIVHDISERKQIEKERLENVNRTLNAFRSTIEAIAMTTEIKDPYTAGHQRRVAELAVNIAKEMGLPDDRTEGIRLAGLVHDIGKIYIPFQILSKPGRLNDIEFNMIKMHAQAGFDILKSIDFPWPIALMVLQHHMRLDGSGYPDCAKEYDMLDESYILAVADVVEAMSSHRPYRPALGIDKALDEVVKNSGTLYKPEVVSAALKLFNEKGFKFK